MPQRSSVTLSAFSIVVSSLHIRRALCYHCSRDLCLDHLTAHAQLIDDLTRSQLDDYFSMLETVSSRLQALTIPSKVCEEPFLQMEQWRQQAYRQIDQLVEKKSEEIRGSIEDYRQIFERVKSEQVERINRYKQKIAELFRKSQVSHRDLSQLKKTIEQIQTDSNSFDQHAIEVINHRPSTHSLNIQMRCPQIKSSTSSTNSSSSTTATTTSSSSSSVIRQYEFQIKCVRLSGWVTSHDVLVQANGTIGDLIEQFIVQQDRLSLIRTERDHYLATEVSQHRIRQRFTSDLPLKSIFNRIESLVLYETPFELNVSNLQQSCLILSRFEEGLPWEIKFGLPFLLSVPRLQCRGQDIIDTIDQKLNSWFPLLNPTRHFQVRLMADDRQMHSAIVLKDWADRVIDENLLMTDNATLVINLVCPQQPSSQEQTIQRARLDGTLKTSERRRRRSRK